MWTQILLAWLIRTPSITIIPLSKCIQYQCNRTHLCVCLSQVIVQSVKIKLPSEGRLKAQKQNAETTKANGWRESSLSDN